MKRYLVGFTVVLAAYMGAMEWQWQRTHPDVTASTAMPEPYPEGEYVFGVWNPVPDPASVWSDAERKCMALNIFYEAGVENEAGKIAVGQVTLNRLKTGRWGNNVCSVVYAKSQFSWTNNTYRAKPKGAAWDASVKAANKVLAGKKFKYLKTSLFYHTNYIKPPKWADSKNKIVQLGQHIFYTIAKLQQDPKHSNT